MDRKRIKAMSILDHNFNGSSDTFDDRLIDLVKEHPAIYDVNDINYRRNTTRQEIWHKISKILGASSKICQVKWKNIRYNYLAEVKNPKNPNIRRRRLTRDLSFLKSTALTYKKREKKSSDNGYIYKPENQDDFYEIVMVDPSEDESTIEGASSITCIPDDEIDIKPVVINDTDTKVTASDDTAVAPNRIPLPPEPEPEPANSLQITEVATSSVSDFRTPRRDEEWNPIPRREPERAVASDPIEMYCLSLADSLRAMTRNERERVKFEFASILKDAQYQDNF